MVHANEFEPLVLRCAVTSEPRSQVVWRREDGAAKLDEASLNLGQAGPLDVGQLVFRSFRRQQAGSFLVSGG